MSQMREWVIKRLIAETLTHQTAANFRAAAIHYAMERTNEAEMAMLVAAVRFSNVVRSKDAHGAYQAKRNPQAETSEP